MVTTYRLNVNELSSELLQSIKEAFKGKEIEITVMEAEDDFEEIADAALANEILSRVDAGTEKIHDWMEVKKSL